MRGVEECYRGKHVRVFRLNRPAILATLTERARRLLAEQPDIIEIWLFGSLARGDAGPGSDADLLIVTRSAPLPFLERPARLAPSFAGTGVGCDVLVYDAAEFARLRHEPRSLVATALAEGLCLARRPGESAPSPMKKG